MKKPIIAGLAAAAVCALVSSSPALAQSAPLSATATSSPVPAGATQVYPMRAPSLGTVGGVSIDGTGYGSSMAPVPGQPDMFYGLTDRGPNVNGPNGTKIEPLPDFTPAIGEFKITGKQAVLVKRILLRAPDGTPYNGRVNMGASTGETITDLDGNVLSPSPYGYDSEGLVALPDGTFWVSDEYGPYITHFSASGRALQRLSPYDGTLPPELHLREPNKGMEGLTMAPDGKTLVGIMQNGLDEPDGPKSSNVPFVRIVTVNLQTDVTHEFVYVLHTTNGAVNTGVSEIAALSGTRFLVDERDGSFEPNADKKIYEIDLKGATDIGAHSTVSGATYGTDKGLTIGGASLEGLVGKVDGPTATTTLEGAGITPVSSSLFLDEAGLVSAISPDGDYYGHDKVEGLAVLNGGHELVLSNDSDFGISGITSSTPPYQLQAKILPDGKQDSGEFLKVNMDEVPAQFK